MYHVTYSMLVFYGPIYYARVKHFSLLCWFVSTFLLLYIWEEFVTYGHIYNARIANIFSLCGLVSWGETHTEIINLKEACKCIM